MTPKNLTQTHIRICPVKVGKDLSIKVEVTIGPFTFNFNHFMVDVYNLTFFAISHRSISHVSSRIS